MYFNEETFYIIPLFVFDNDKIRITEIKLFIIKTNFRNTFYLRKQNVFFSKNFFVF